jgi:hypothetical protein
MKKQKSTEKFVEIDVKIQEWILSQEVQVPIQHQKILWLKKLKCDSWVRKFNKNTL